MPDLPLEVNRAGSVPAWPWWIVTAGGLGGAPKAPGTFGALGAIPFCVAAAYVPVPWNWALLVGAFLAACAATVACGRWAERYFGRKDAGSFVTDEVAGLLLTWLLIQPVASLWVPLLWAFALTRVFDIAKPPPAKWLEKLPAGWGVLLDDLASSFWAAGALYLLRWLIPTPYGP